MHYMYFFLFANFRHFSKPGTVSSYSANKKWLGTVDKNYIIYGKEYPFVNCEHIVPQSIIKKNKVDQRSKNDLHLLALSNAKINSHRQNYKFVDFESEYSKSMENIVYITANGNIGNKKDFICKKHTRKQIFEPPESSKGRIARSVCYFYLNYGSSHLTKEIMERKIILKWHKKHPVSTQEKQRNILVCQKQKNKNIFVSKPIMLHIFLFPPIFYLKIMIDVLRKK